MPNQLPIEVQEFESLLQRPNSDPTGFAGFFNSGEIWVARVPARLDVIGGIADYSGSNVCEATLGRGMLMALQPRTDSTLRIRTMQAGSTTSNSAPRKSLPIETRIPLTYFSNPTSPRTLADYADIRELCHANPLVGWAGYIGGSIFTLLKEQSIQLPFGFSMLLLSAVPMNVGIGSSAAVEIGTLSCLNAYLGLKLDPGRIARLGQMAENYVVGAPCGIMDQTAITSGRQGKMTHILCRPGQVMGEVEIPRGTGFVGINSMVRHSVAGNPYADVRIGAFMGKKIINAIRAKGGGASKPPLNYLTELSTEELRRDYLPHLPESLLGSAFLSQYHSHDDPVTTIQPDATYRIAGPTRHPIEENERVLTFMTALRAAAKGAGPSGADALVGFPPSAAAANSSTHTQALITAGEMMYGAHESYRDNCRLSVEGVDFLVDAVRKRGPAQGLYGAKITGGGTGGTVAVFGQLDSLAHHIPQIATEYSRRIGAMPDLFEGTSPGAAEFGARRYNFTAQGWKAQQVDW